MRERNGQTGNKWHGRMFGVTMQLAASDPAAHSIIMNQFNWAKGAKYRLQPLSHAEINYFFQFFFFFFSSNENQNDRPRRNMLYVNGDHPKRIYFTKQTCNYFSPESRNEFRSNMKKMQTRAGAHGRKIYVYQSSGEKDL